MGNPATDRLKPIWTVERHGGGRKHGWRRCFGGNEKPARNQIFMIHTQMSQGGVRLINPAGEIVEAWWRRHAPGARAEKIRFCIGCGCHDHDACVEPLDEGVPCHWIKNDARAVGVCSCCRPALKRWRTGDRVVRTNRT